MTTTSAYATLDDLITPVADVTEEVDLGGGLVVVVRGLTRYELLLNGKGAGADDTGLVERRNLACCLVEPRLSVAQVEAWQKGSTPDVIGKVTTAIRRLSGLAEGAAKSDVSGDGDERSGV